jgi:EAL domain-containing protein (putative c-di-GMP-specific phosphodiesterase class I)
VKIDKSFVRLIDSNQQYSAIVSGIIKLAHSLGMSVIAEGVETAVQRAILTQEQCDEIQGQLISMPLSPAEFSDWWYRWELGRMNSESEHESSELITQWH